MIRRPEFTIIAGPNGAGKSRLGPFYSSTKAFDGDNLAMKLRKEHSDWKDSWVEGMVISTLMKEKDEAAFWVVVWLWVALIASWTTIAAVIVMNVKEWVK